MTDEYTGAGYRGRDRPGRARLLLGGGLAAVLLAVVGGTGGGCWPATRTPAA